MSVLTWMCVLALSATVNGASLIVQQPISTASTVTSQKQDKPVQLAQQELLDCLTSGQWHEEKYSHEQGEAIKTFLRKTRTNYRLPDPLQRSDGLCGSVAFGEGGLSWFRAVCDPYQDTPCCMDGKCQNKTADECVCENCYDLRSRLDAELSTWKNYDDKCQVRNFTSDAACDVMSGDFHFIGDSHLRHMYMGLQILLTGDAESGCMVPDLSPELKTECHGLYMFTEKVCRERVMSTHSVCGGKVTLHLYELYSSVYIDQILSVVSGLVGKPGSVVVMGIGHHDSFDPQTVIPKVTSPILELLENSGQIWPKIIWVGVHSLGLLKTPVVPKHLNPNVIIFNQAMREFLALHQVNFLNTFDLTKGVSSPDGSHYGRGVNLLKARVFLEYISRVGNISRIADHLLTNTTTVQQL